MTPSTLDNVVTSEDFVAQASRWRLALLFVGCAAFVSIGIWMGGVFGVPPESRRYSPEVVFALGWFCALFFGLCAAIAFVRLIRGGEQLRIGTDGVRCNIWSDATIPWSEISDVTIWTFKRQKAIVLHLRDPARFPGRGLLARLGSGNPKVTGGDVAISMTGTDRTFEDALAAVEHFRR
jgi:hypothetical protein